MKKYSLISFSLLLFIALWSCNPSKKTQFDNSNIKTAGLDIPKDEADLLYTALVDSAIDNPTNTDYEKLRFAHAASSNYKPYADNEGLTKLRDLIKDEEYEVASEVLQTYYRTLFHDALFHYYAFVIWKNLEDEDMAKIHSYYYSKLIESIIQNKEGTSKKDAFIVINISEEYRVMEYLEMKMVEQNLIEDGLHSFDKIKAQDEDGKTKHLYFNIDLPFSSLINMFD